MSELDVKKLKKYYKCDSGGVGGGGGGSCDDSGSCVSGGVSVKSLKRAVSYAGATQN